MTQAFIRIKQGNYRGMDASGKVFALVKQFAPSANGGTVTVLNGNVFPNYPETIKIKVASFTDYEFVSGGEFAQEGGTMPAEVVASTETDEQVMERIAGRFDMLDKMAAAACNGNIRAMIVSGPPGVGKSYGVERELEKASLFDKIAGRRIKCEVIKGSTTALGLYCQLYKYSDEGSVLVFDDCDSILLDDVSLNLLKGALDSGKKRRISWLADSSMLRREGVPDQFDFKGSVIFITNLKFDKMKSQKLRDHLDALQSRCHYLDLTLDTMRDKICRIKQIARSGELFSDYDIEEAGQAEIIDFMESNQNRLREMSLRMAVKIAELYASFKQDWKKMCEVTCMRSA
jgi:hypothetical protein